MPLTSRKDSHESRLTYTLSISSWVRAFKPEWLLVFSICAVGQSLLWRGKKHITDVCGGLPFRILIPTELFYYYRHIHITLINIQRSHFRINRIRLICGLKWNLTSLPPHPLKKKIMLSGVDVKINFFSTSDTDGRGNYESMLLPAFLPPPQPGVTSSRSHQEYSTVLLEWFVWPEHGDREVLFDCATVCFGLWPVVLTFHTLVCRSDPAMNT